MKIIPKEELSGLIDIAKGDDDLLAIVRKYIFHGIPYIFNDNQDAYYEFRNRIAKQFNINFDKEKAIFVVAGAPACSEELQKAGIENFIHIKLNVLETLKTLNTKLGI